MSNTHPPATEQLPSESGGSGGSSGGVGTGGSTSGGGNTDYGTGTCPVTFTDSEGSTWTSTDAGATTTGTNSSGETFTYPADWLFKTFGTIVALPEDDGTSDIDDDKCTAESHGTAHPVQSSSSSSGEHGHESSGFAALIRAAQAPSLPGQHTATQGSAELHLSLLHPPAAAEHLAEHLTTAHDASIVQHVPVIAPIVHDEHVAVHAPIIDHAVHH